MIGDVFLCHKKKADKAWEGPFGTLGNLMIIVYSVALLLLIADNVYDQPLSLIEKRL